MAEQEQARLIAERIARRVAEAPSDPGPTRSGSEVGAEIASVRAGISELQRKLTQLEAKMRSGSNEASVRTGYQPVSRSVTEEKVLLTHSPWLAGVNASFSHPSEERFGVEEATVSELVDFFEKEKTCGVEPGGKPCDHCAMCSSRGF